MAEGKDAGGFRYDSSTSGNGPTTSGKRRLIADKDNEVIKVAAVTGLRSDQNQVQDLLRWIVSAVERPAPTPEVSDIRKMLLQLTREWSDEPAPVVDAPLPTLEQMLRSVIDGQRRRERLPQRQRQNPRQWLARRDWSEAICFSCGKTGHPATRYLDYNDSLPFMQPGWQKEKTPGGFEWQWTDDERKTTTDPGGGPSPRVRDKARPRDPGGGERH